MFVRPQGLQSVVLDSTDCKHGLSTIQLHMVFLILNFKDNIQFSLEFYKNLISFQDLLRFSTIIYCSFNSVI